MMKRMRKYGRSRFSKSRRLTRRAKLGGTRLRRTITSVTKRVLRRRVEKKYVSKNVLFNTSFNSIISSTADVYPLLPEVPQGTDDWQRIGSRIKPAYLLVNVKIQYVGDTVGNSVPALYASTARLMIVENKSFRSSTQAVANFAPNKLLDDRVGTSVTHTYTGAPADNFAPINTDIFKVHHNSLHRFNWDYHNSFAGTTAAGNNLTQYVSVRIKCPAQLDFDTSSNEATNFAPLLLFGYTYDDGTSPDISDRKFRLTCQTRLVFTDE